MKKKLFFAAIAVFAGVLFTACSNDNEPVSVTGISLDKQTLSLVVSTSGQLTATVVPNDATDKSVNWTTSDAAVATVSDGNVTAVAVGEATITVTTKDGGKIATCAVTVIPVPIPAQSITLDTASLKLTIGEEYTLTATVLPANSTDNVEWQTSNAAVATVSNGLVTAIAVGNAIITAQAGTQSATCQISVKDGVRINGVIWAKYNVDMPNTFATTPESAGMFYQWNRKIGWSSTDPMVNSDGGTTWDNTAPEGTEWETDNDPSPEGWRVPTLAQLQTLLNTAKVSSQWTTQSGVNGRLFTDLQNGNSLFLPAAGYRYYSDGTLLNAGTYGYYWSSTQRNSDYAYNLYFNSSNAYTDYYYRRNGFCVRSVAVE